MSPNTVSRSRTTRHQGIASQGVLSVGHGLKMIRVDAVAHPTKVVKNKTIGDRPPGEFVSDAMRALLIKLSISISKPAGLPEPARLRAFNL